jgi:hypothetical protein
VAFCATAHTICGTPKPLYRKAAVVVIGKIDQVRRIEEWSDAGIRLKMLSLEYTANIEVVRHMACPEYLS